MVSPVTRCLEKSISHCSHTSECCANRSALSANSDSSVRPASTRPWRASASLVEGIEGSLLMALNEGTHRGWIQHHDGAREHKLLEVEWKLRANRGKLRETARNCATS